MLRIGNIKQQQDAVNVKLSPDPKTSSISIQKSYKRKTEDLSKRAEALETSFYLVVNELEIVLNENPQFEIVRTGKGHVIPLPLKSEKQNILNEKEEDLQTYVFNLEQESNQILLQMEKAYALIAIYDKRLSRIRNKRI
jgi:hypothetical protein